MFDIFKECKDYYSDSMKDFILGKNIFSEIEIYSSDFELNVSSNNVVIDESSLLEILKEKYLEIENPPKEIKKNVLFRINLKNINFNDGTNIIFTSSKKVDLPNIFKSKNILIYFDTDFASRNFNFVWDIDKGKHTENVFYKFYILKLIEDFDFKSDYFDCIDTNFYKTLEIYFKWHKKYGTDKYKKLFANFITAISKNSPDSYFKFYFYIEDEDILKNICDSGIYDLYLSLLAKTNKLMFDYYPLNEEITNKFKKLYKDEIDCSGKEFEVKNIKQMNFKTKNIFPKDIFPKMKLKSLKFKNINEFNLYIDTGLECESLIIENIKNKFTFNSNVDVSGAIEYGCYFPKDIIIKNSKINELYLDEDFMNNFYLFLMGLYDEGKKIEIFDNVIFENITVKNFYINAGILPFINNSNFEIAIENFYGFHLPFEMIFKNVKAENLNIIFSLGSKTVFFDRVLKDDGFKFLFNIIFGKKDSRLKKYFKNKDVFLEYLLTNTKDSFLFSELIKLANNLIKSENVNFGLKKANKKIVFLSKKQNKFLELVSKNPKNFLNFKKIEKFLMQDG